MFSRPIIITSCVVLLEAYAALAATIPTKNAICHRSLTVGAPSSEECTDLDTWGTGEYMVQDCYDAVQHLHESEVYRYPRQEWEFLAPGARPREKPLFLTMQTPRRYTSGSCTVAIVMLDFFRWGELPGEDPRYPPAMGFPDSDVASFRDIWAVAQRLEMCCLTLEGTPGWGRAGKHRSIGVFIWSTNSAKNNNVPQGVGAPFDAFSHGRGLNSTAWE